MSNISKGIDRFYTSGTIPSIAANTAIQVHAHLLRNGETVQPSFVHVEKGCQVITTTSPDLTAGYFAVWNPTNDEVTSIPWNAEYQHPIEMAEYAVDHDQADIGEIPVPSGPWDYTGE